MYAGDEWVVDGESTGYYDEELDDGYVEDDGYPEDDYPVNDGREDYYL